MVQLAGSHAVNYSFVSNITYSNGQKCSIGAGESAETARATSIVFAGVMFGVRAPWKCNQVPTRAPYRKERCDRTSDMPEAVCPTSKVVLGHVYN